MNVLVTGGAGYIGSFIVAALLKRGHFPIVIDDLSSGTRQSLPNEIRFYEGDIGNLTLLGDVFKRESLDLVMHCAAKVQIGESVKHPSLYYDNNVVKTAALIDSMMRYGVKSMVYSSTAAVYGSPKYLPIDECHPAEPVNPYGTSKKMAETILADYHKAYGIRCVVLRYFNVAGASLDGTMGESHKVKQNLIPIILENIQKGSPITIFGSDWSTDDGTCIRDYVHVEDVADAHCLAAEHLMDGNGYEIVNLGSGNAVSVREVIKAIVSALGKEVAIEIGQRRPGDVTRLVASSVKAETLFGWSPKRSDIGTIVGTAYSWHFNRRY